MVSIKRLKFSIACGLILLTAIFFISCEKEDPREAILEKMSGRYCLIDAVWEGEPFDFNGDGTISYLMDEIKTADGYFFIKNTLNLYFRYQPGLFDSAFTVSMPIQICDRTYDERISSPEVNYCSTTVEYNMVDAHKIIYTYPEISISYSGKDICTEYSDAFVSFDGDIVELSYKATFRDMSKDKEVTGKVSYIYAKYASYAV